jgi:hypothetical protein
MPWYPGRKCNGVCLQLNWLQFEDAPIPFSGACLICASMEGNVGTQDMGTSTYLPKLQPEDGVHTQVPAPGPASPWGEVQCNTKKKIN